MSNFGLEYCEECGGWATKHWGMDNTPLCDEDYAAANRKYEATVQQMQEWLESRDE